MNSSTHNIKIHPYKEGYVVTKNVIKLEPNESIQIAYGHQRGISNGGGFSSEYFYDVDSAVVVFDDVYKVSHYTTTPDTYSSKYYKYSTQRNLLNYHTYEYEYEDISKHSRHQTYTYKFTDSDYDFAK